METIKDPAMILSVANSIGLVGSIYYTYKQLEGLRTDVNKLHQNLTTILRKVAELEKGDQAKTESLHALSDEIKRINENISNIPLDSIESDFIEIVSILEENEIYVERPSQPRSRYTSGDRRSSYTNSRSISNVRNNDKFRTDTSRDRDMRGGNRNREVVRTPPSLKPEISNRYDEAVNDEDIISEVNRATTRL